MHSGTREMAQQLNALATFLEDPDLIPRTHVPVAPMWQLTTTCVSSSPGSKCSLLSSPGAKCVQCRCVQGKCPFTKLMVLKQYVFH